MKIVKLESAPRSRKHLRPDRVQSDMRIIAQMMSDLDQMMALVTTRHRVQSER